MGLITRRVELNVPFHDVDPAGVVWHGHYFRYLELARCKALEALGYSYREMAASGYIWPVTDLSCRFTAPIRYQDDIVIEATLVEWEYRLVFDYRVLSPDGQELARGHTTQVPVDQESGELVIGNPPVLDRCIADYQARHPVD